MIWKLVYRMLKETDKKLLVQFLYNFAWKGRGAVKKFYQRKKQGKNFPAFLMISLTNQCNLHCKGCWITPSQKPVYLPLGILCKIIETARQNGSYFFGLLGGEPLLHPELFSIIQRYPDCYFQVFTNGTLLDDRIAREMRRLGNVTPLISIEGREKESDERRGGREVYRKSMEGILHCKKNKLITGVACSVCKSNFQDMVSEDCLKDMISAGVHYIWYYIYRPVGENPCPEIALSQEQILHLRKFMVEMRTRFPLIIVDAYWDDKGNALCPAATGISHHINPYGDVEFCPPLLFSKDNIGDGSSLEDILEQSEFLKKLRHFCTQETRGCVILECPDRLQKFLSEEKARDTSGRPNPGQFSQSFACSHHIPGQEIPEKHWAYRLAKKYYFFGFGAYG